MRLLKLSARGKLSLTEDFVKEDIPPYAILSHTWGTDNDEYTFSDLQNGSGKNKTGYAKIRFCRRQAEKDGLQYFWVDTCCIDKANHTELSEAIVSMFGWYRDAVKCYVYLSDVSARKRNDNGKTEQTWEPAFRNSRWFKRGWTLQELLAPASVEFFARGELLGDKTLLEQQIHEITGIPVMALRGSPLSQFSVDERKQWAETRETRKPEDKAYCLLGIFDVSMSLRYGEGEKAFVRLLKKIDGSSIRSLPSTSHMHWTVSRPTNPFFTGREDILGDLEDIVRNVTQSPPRHEPCRIVISGMGGQGKSEICLQLAHRVRQSFWGVFWVDVSTVYLAETGFLDVASRLHIPAQTLEDARQGLSNVQQPWLLVLDNADDPHVDYQHYFPTGPLGVVLLTSRNDGCHQYATDKCIALDGLVEAEARELLLKASRVPRDQHPMFEDDAQVVASLLRSHALALIQAGAYVSRGHCTLAEYPRVYAQERKRLLTFRPIQAHSRYRDVYATFEASAEILQSSHSEAAEDALQLLPVLATCGPSRLPLTLFEAGWKGAQSISLSQPAGDVEAIHLTPWHIFHLLPLIQAQADTWDSFRLVEAIHLLKAFSLVSTDTHNDHLSVSTHPLIHAWARDRQDPEQQHKSWLAMGCLVAISREDSVFWREHGRQLLPHLQALTSWDVDRMFASELTVNITCILINCGWLLCGMRDDANLFILMHHLLGHLGLHRSAVDPRWLPVYDITARNLVHCGKAKEAAVLLEQVVEIKDQTLTEDHPDLLASQHALATAYEANGQVKEAVALLEQVVKIRDQALGEDHPSRLASQHALAIAYKSNGQVKEAVALLEQVVKIKDQTLGEDHPSRLVSQHALAIAYEANGQVKEAVALLEQVVKIRDQTLAEDHPDRLASQHALAAAYEANGQVGRS